ncbi:MAG: orotate phosphoribosyltransferase [Alphaproteobacteria bacterium]|nr:orotate phosphoribosyltransferase [Alphaproteobacteria bacterium]
MTEAEVLDHYRATGALLSGHFILSSGLRSPQYMQSARVLMHPRRAEALGRALATRLTEAVVGAIDLVLSPAMGGLIIGHEVGRALDRPALFTERVEGRMALRRGFDVAAGQRFVVIEDVVTTGKSTRECAAAVAALGGVLVGVGSIVDRTEGALDLGVPYVALAKLAIPNYKPDALPPALAAIPAVKPGSRGL